MTSHPRGSTPPVLQPRSGSCAGWGQGGLRGSAGGPPRLACDERAGGGNVVACLSHCTGAARTWPRRGSRLATGSTRCRWAQKTKRRGARKPKRRGPRRPAPAQLGRPAGERATRLLGPIGPIGPMVDKGKGVVCTHQRSPPPPHVFQTLSASRQRRRGAQGWVPPTFNVMEQGEQ
jgi:hypothetical protein